jgi:hypothetical protein
LAIVVPDILRIVDRAPPPATDPHDIQDAKMAKKREPVDELLDALVWMRRKAKKHQPVDDLIDALIGMRRKAKKKTAKRKRARAAKR